GRGEPDGFAQISDGPGPVIFHAINAAAVMKNWSRLRIEPKRRAKVFDSVVEISHLQIGPTAQIVDSLLIRLKADKLTELVNGLRPFVHDEVTQAPKHRQNAEVATTAPPWITCR